MIEVSSVVWFMFFIIVMWLLRRAFHDILAVTLFGSMDRLTRRRFHGVTAKVRGSGVKFAMELYLVTIKNPIIKDCCSKNNISPALEV